MRLLLKSVFWGLLICLFGTGWLLAEDKEPDKKELPARRAEAIRKLGVYKGVLDRKGADKGVDDNARLPWDNARQKETDHFTVKTDLSADALTDTCIILECAYFAWQDLLEFADPETKALLLLFKNNTEFNRMGRRLTGSNYISLAGGCFLNKDDFPDKLQQDCFLMFYQPLSASALGTVATLLHEGTHYAMALLGRQASQPAPPMWVNEGLATYFETSTIEGNNYVIYHLVSNHINKLRLSWLKLGIKNLYPAPKLEKLKDIIHNDYRIIDSFNYNVYWGLVYFLLNGSEGKYQAGFKAYLNAWKNGQITVLRDKRYDWALDQKGHIKLFEECMGVPIDQFEKEWQEYILALKDK